MQLQIQQRSHLAQVEPLMPRRRTRRALHVDDWIGKQAVWTAKTRVQEVTILVKVIDAREQFGRIDCLIETNTGSRAWVSNLTLELVEDPLSRKQS